MMTAEQLSDLYHQSVELFEAIEAEGEDYDELELAEQMMNDAWDAMHNECMRVMDVVIDLDYSENRITIDRK
jgi:hypothetical protein